MNSEGLAYRYGFINVDNSINSFYRFYEDGEQRENFEFKQISDFTWQNTYNDEGVSVTKHYIKHTNNDTLTFSIDGNEKSGEYTIHYYTVEDVIRKRYDYLSGTVRVETFLNDQLLGWGKVVFSKDEYYTITTGTE